MIDTKYTYAVARIRALETSLLNSAVIEQLMACQTDVQCLQLLQEKGWGDADTPENAEAILSREQEKIWETIRSGAHGSFPASAAPSPTETESTPGESARAPFRTMQPGKTALAMTPFSARRAMTAPWRS